MLRSVPSPLPVGREGHSDKVGGDKEGGAMALGEHRTALHCTAVAGCTYGSQESAVRAVWERSGACGGSVARDEMVCGEQEWYGMWRHIITDQAEERVDGGEEALLLVWNRREEAKPDVPACMHACMHRGYGEVRCGAVMCDMV